MASIFPRARKKLCRVGVLVLALVSVWTDRPVRAVTPESPEVHELIQGGLKFLESNGDHRLGGKCLIALAFLKNGASQNHLRITEAVDACQKELEQPTDPDNYSVGLAVILLSELKSHRNVLEHFVGLMQQRQRKDGAWGYPGYPTGDTSQTQYTALSYWELMRIGLYPSVESADACANWFLRTQDPSGTWGYQGIDPGNFNLVPQSAESSTPSSMLAAGMGSLLIFGHILGIVQPHDSQPEDAPQERLPSALRVAETEQEKKLQTLAGSTVDRTRLREAIDRGRDWYNTNFKFEGSHYPCYVLYSLERYKSFEELLTGNAPIEPDWYQKGYEYLKNSRKPNGSWTGGSGPPCETAFAVLFLLRSAQKSIKASLGEGTLIGGRGLSADLSRMRMRGGRLVKENKPTEVDKMLEMLEGDDSLDDLLDDSASLQVENLGPEDARRLQQIVKSGSPEARLLAVRALSEMRNLDYVPTLLFAMTDPDHRVVRAASNGLMFVSRRFDSFGLPDNFTNEQRLEALDRWKQWYHRVRPATADVP